METYLLNKSEIASVAIAASPLAEISLYGFFEKVLKDNTFSEEVHIHCLDYFIRQAKRRKTIVFETLSEIALNPTTDKEIVLLIIKYISSIDTPLNTFATSLILKMPTDLMEYIVETVPFKSIKLPRS